MNVQEALTTLAAVIEANSQAIAQLDSIKEFAENAEALTAEYLGTENDSVVAFGRVSVQSETAGNAGRQFTVEMEHLQEILQAIQ